MSSFSDSPGWDYEVGVRVELHSLLSKPELNGRRGAVTKCFASSGRVAVLLDEGRAPLSLSPSNLRKVDDDVLPNDGAAAAAAAAEAVDAADSEEPQEPQDGGDGPEAGQKSGRSKKKKKKKKKALAAVDASASGGGGGGGAAGSSGGGGMATTRDVTVTLASGETMTITRALVTDVATAAGVDWGDDPVPARMQELQRRHDQLLAIHEKGDLSLHDIRDHNEYLAGLTSQIFDEGEAMKRKYRGASAQAVRWANKGPKRAAQYEAILRGIRNRETSFNREVKMAQFEVDWLKKSPAWSQAMDFLEENWIKTEKGYVSKYDLKKDQEVSFEDMLNQMKL